MGTRFYLEGLWQQFVNTRVTFKLLCKDDCGLHKDTNATITAFLKGPRDYQAVLFRENLGVYVIEFTNPDCEGDYQMYVLVNGHILYQWLVQLRSQTAHGL
eukprot:TRINITY_DN1842_c0_g4_i15.p2 TRINITY_DN1842_c0_g4~~TRINITY_DN1842_c0_g4_i15.p2  ORF type:complete len:101 (-),score=11.58 TRINITY_DN1842_c0_g4_i15:34-336(-)